MGFKKDESTMMPESTTMKESTMKEAPTQSFYRMLTAGNNKCGTNSKVRAFREDFSTVEACLTRCYDDDSCTAASMNNGNTLGETEYCIGCKTLNQKVDSWTAYEMIRGRRQLSELEQLRAENAALKAELARRN